VCVGVCETRPGVGRGATRARGGSLPQTPACRPPEREFSGSYLRLIGFVSLNSRLESNKEEEEEGRGRELAVDPFLKLPLVVLLPNRKVDVRLPGKGNSKSHGARPVHQIITMIKWIRTSRLAMKERLELAVDAFLELPLVVLL